MVFLAAVRWCRRSGCLMSRCISPHKRTAHLYPELLRSSQAGRSCPFLRRKVPFGKSCLQTCSQETKCPTSSHKLKGQSAARVPWSIGLRHERCIPNLGGRTPLDPNQSDGACGLRDRSWCYEVSHRGAWCPWSGRNRELSKFHTCRSECQNL